MILITSTNFLIIILFISLICGFYMLNNELKRKNNDSSELYNVKLVSIIRSIGLIAVGIIGLILLYFKYDR
jgi:cbb3-type cytochrome oxidase subunit 3